MMDFCTLASGSSGNAALVSRGNTHILLDAGISARRIAAALKTLGLDLGDLSAVFVTHEHQDHISGLATLTKHHPLPIYASPQTCRQLCYRIPFVEDLVHPQPPGAGVELGDFWVESFPTPHDAAGSVGYTLCAGGCKLTLVTDLGHVTAEVRNAVQGSDLLVCEANHDEDWLRSGPYPPYLIQRVLGDFGHLSNEAGAELAALAAESGTRCIVLAHLSAQNNTPAHAYQVVQRRLEAIGLSAREGLSLSVAPKGEVGPIHKLAKDTPVRAFAQKAVGLC